MFMRKLLFLVLSIALLSLGGCDGNSKQTDVKKQVAKIKAAPAIPIEPLPPIKPTPKAKYSAHHLRSPFKIPKNLRAATGKSSSLNRKKEPLETFSLDALKMVGTIKQGHRLWALIQIPSGTIYAVSTGAYIGKNRGQIIDVTPKAVKLIEEVQVNGTWKQHKAEILLRKEN